MKTLWYSTDSDGDEERTKFETPFTEDSDYAASDAAEHYWDTGGWECSWPITFTIYATEDGPAAGRFKVEMEAIPSFTAYQIEEVPHAD